MKLEQPLHIIESLYSYSIRDISKSRDVVARIYDQWQQRVKSEYSEFQLLPNEDMSAIEDRLEKLFREEMIKRGIVLHEP